VTYRRFEVPDWQEISDVLGVTPESTNGSEVFDLHFVATAEHLDVTIDEFGRSIRCRWSKGDEVLLDVVREGAVVMRIESSETSKFIRIGFETDDLVGDLEVRCAPVFALRDKLLFR